MKKSLIYHVSASGCYTALCLASLSIITDILIIKSKPDWLYFSFLFFTTFFYYNFHKISWFKHPRMLNKQNLKYMWPGNFPGILLLSLIIGFAGSAALLSFYIDNPVKVFLGLVAGFIAIIYNLKIFGIQLRSIKGLKAFTIALVTIIPSIFIPIAEENIWSKIDPIELALFSFAEFFFITALCIGADIRDIQEDKEDKIKSFPVAAGIQISKKIIYLLLLIQATFFIVLYEISFLNFKQLELFLLVCLLSMLITNQLNSKKSYYYFIFVIDGLIITQSTGIYLLSL